SRGDRRGRGGGRSSDDDLRPCEGGWWTVALVPPRGQVPALRPRADGGAVQRASAHRLRRPARGVLPLRARRVSGDVRALLGDGHDVLRALYERLARPRRGGGAARGARRTLACGEGATGRGDRVSRALLRGRPGAAGASLRPLVIAHGVVGL